MNKQIDVNKFNTLISQASDAILCNSDCKKQRKTDKLKQDFLNSQSNLASAPSQVQMSEEKYITFTQGKSAYNELLDEQLQEKAEEISNKFIEFFKTDSQEIKTQIETYHGLLLNFKNVVDLYLKYKTENVELVKNLKQESSDILTNERKTYYEDQKIYGLKSFYYYIFLIIYIICFIAFVVFTMLYQPQTDLKKKIATFLGFALLPFLSTRILGSIISLAYKLYNLLPTNVYAEKNY